MADQTKTTNKKEERAANAISSLSVARSTTGLRGEIGLRFKVARDFAGKAPHEQPFGRFEFFTIAEAVQGLRNGCLSLSSSAVSGSAPVTM